MKPLSFSCKNLKFTSRGAAPHPTVSHMRPKNEDGVLKNRTGPYEGVSRRETARWKAIAYSYLAHYFVLDPTQRIGLRYDETGWICTARSVWAKNTTCDIEERAKIV